jgi:hypothetical protein
VLSLLGPRLRRHERSSVEVDAADFAPVEFAPSRESERAQHVASMYTATNPVKDGLVDRVDTGLASTDFTRC